MSPIQRPTRDQVLLFETRQALRDWFEAHHQAASEAFIGYCRGGVGKPSTTWEEAVEEALCFGWIDGITFRIDEVTANRFTTRRVADDRRHITVSPPSSPLAMLDCQR